MNEGMDKIGLFIVVLGLVILLPTFIIQAAPVKLHVFATGAGSDPDQKKAIDHAKKKAESMFVCTGALENIRLEVSGCRNFGGEDSSFTCAVVGSATCVNGR